MKQKISKRNLLSRFGRSFVDHKNVSEERMFLSVDMEVAIAESQMLYFI